MTEIKRQSTVQPEQTQGFNSPAEDELNLKDLLRLLARKIKFILAITSFCTLFSIFYAQSITPVYRVTVGLLDHNEIFSSMSILGQLDPKIAAKIGNSNTKPRTIFERFLLNIKSYKFKQGVFVKGGFEKKFSRETGIDTDESVSETYNSTEIVKLDGIDYLALEGSKPKVMLEFLTALVEAAKENVNTEINAIQRSTVKTRINNLSSKIEELHQKFTLQKQREKIKQQIEKEKNAAQELIEKEKKVRENQKYIARLSKALAIAKNLGIRNNHFGVENNGKSPLWFQYGELALQQEIMSLRAKEEEIPNTKNLAIEKHKLKSYKQKIMSLGSKEKESSNTKNLTIEKLKLERSRTADLPLLKFKVATISKHSYGLVKPYQPLVIVGFGLAFGLFISICMAFLIDLKQLGAKEIPSTST